MPKALCLLAAIIWFSAPAAMAQYYPDGSSGPPATATATGSAQIALVTLRKAKTPADLANVLTDDTAGDTATYWATFMAFGYLAANTIIGQNAVQSTTHDPNLFADLTILLQHYHVTTKALMKGTAADTIKLNGREILAKMSPLIARWNAIVAYGPGGSGVSTPPVANSPTLPPFDLPSFVRRIPAGIGAYGVTFASRQRLILNPTQITTPGEPASFEALLDDDKWRLRIPSVVTVWQAQVPASAALPPMHDLPDSPPAEDTSAAPLFEAINDLNLASVKRILTAHPEWLNSYNRLGETPLSKAVYDRSKPIVAYILTLHPDLKAVDAVGMTALDKAEYWHLDGIAAMLKTAGAQ